MINSPQTLSGANSVVGFDIDSYVAGREKPAMPKGNLQKAKEDTVELGSKKSSKAKKVWKAFGTIFLATLAAIISASFMKKLIKH